MHYYEFNIADYRKDTFHLSPIEHYIYRQLIDWYFLDEKPITKNNLEVLRRLRLDSSQEPSLQSVFNDFFILDGEYYIHQKIADMIARYQARGLASRSNGKKGGRPKGDTKQHVKIKAKPSNNLDKPNSNLKEPTNHKPITNNHKLKDKEKEKKAVSFKKPTIDEVVDHSGGDVDMANSFYNYYESIGWRVGKNKMVRWKGAFANWLQRSIQWKKDSNKKENLAGGDWELPSNISGICENNQFKIGVE